MPEKAEKKRWPLWKKLLAAFGAAFTLAWLLPFLYVCVRLAYEGHCTRQYRRNEPAAHPGSVWVCEQPYIRLEVQSDRTCTGFAVLDGEKIAVEMGSRMSGTSIEVLDGEYKGVRVLWNGLTEAREGEFIFLEAPYVNRLTDGDGPLVFVRQPEGAQPAAAGG